VTEQKRELEELRTKVREKENQNKDLTAQVGQLETARNAVLDDNTIDKHHISDALKDMRQQMDSQLNRLRVEAGDIELQRRHHLVSEQLQENKVRNEVLLKEMAQVRTSSRLATIERDSFKAEAETNARELARARHEREDLVETIARLQLELRRQQERHDDNLIEKARSDFANLPRASSATAFPGSAGTPEELMAQARMRPDVLGIAPIDMERPIANNDHDSEWANAAARAVSSGDEAAIMALSNDMAAKAERIKREGGDPSTIANELSRALQLINNS